MGDLKIKYDELTAEEFIRLWESVWGDGPSLEQTKLAMDNTLFRVSIFDYNDSCHLFSTPLLTGDSA